MITRETDYAIRIVLYLAEEGPDSGPVSARHIAEEMDIPYRFLRLISLKLVQAGILNSRRGKNGGLMLAKPPSELSLLEVMRTVDKKTAVLNRCLIDETTCNRTGHCSVHHTLLDLQDRVDRALDTVTFENLAKPHP